MYFRSTYRHKKLILKPTPILANKPTKNLFKKWLQGFCITFFENSLYSPQQFGLHPFPQIYSFSKLLALAS